MLRVFQTTNATVQALGHARQPNVYAQLLQRLDDIAGSTIARVIDVLPELSEPGVARQLSAQLPPGRITAMITNQRTWLTQH